jgi:nicotinamidase-related amidase
MAGSPTALLLIDFQEWIVRDLVSEGGPEAARRAAVVATGVRAAGGLVVHVQYLHSDGSDGGAGSDEARFLNDIDLFPEDPVVTKYGRSAFERTDLEAVLAAESVTGLLVAGVVTEGGVEATANDGLARGYRVEVLADAVAGATPQGHRQALARMRRAGATVVTGEPGIDAGG